jgi:hypothetical protein
VEESLGWDGWMRTSRNESAESELWLWPIEYSTHSLPFRSKLTESGYDNDVEDTEQASTRLMNDKGCNG